VLFRSPQNPKTPLLSVNFLIIKTIILNEFFIEPLRRE
jgi:hypothetical protein